MNAHQRHFYQVSRRSGLAGVLSGLGLMLLTLLGCNGPDPVAQLVVRMTTANHDAGEFPTGHGATENASGDCAPCHGGLPSFSDFTCFSCHAHADETTTTAQHASVPSYAYASNACYGCHPTGEGVGRESHSWFPITSETVHGDAACESCHLTGSYSEFSCLECHEHAQSLMDPAHAAVASYVYESNSCLSCHPDGTALSREDHDDFPIDTASTHKDASCESCHTGAAYSEFSCLECHEHAQSLMDPAHSGVSSYLYESNSCLSCHPDGTALSRDDHNDFPIDSASTHRDASCESCHTGTSYSEFSCLECHEHAKSVMDPAHSGVTGYQFESNSCLSCHPDGNAMSREEHNQYFPITSGDHKKYDCNDCHKDASSYTIFTCIGCHEGEHTCGKMTPEHDEVRNFSCDDNSCYKCHPNGKED